MSEELLIDAFVLLQTATSIYIDRSFGYLSFYILVSGNR